MSVTQAAGDRVLVLATYGRDAALALALLHDAGLEGEACSDLEGLCRELGRGGGLAVIAEEDFATADLHQLAAWVEAQPPWSDFPFVLLTRRLGGLERNPAALRAMTLLGNVSFVERPFHPSTLASAARSALRARRRQYQARDHLREREQAAIALRASEARARERSLALEALNRMSVVVAAELDRDRLIQLVVDAATELTGAAFGAFFHNVTGQAGKSYTLYKLAGAPLEAFSQFPMPRNTHVFAPTFNGEGVVRTDDITQDPRYGRNPPHSGMPCGHLPVRSYLAVPVMRRSGEVAGGLFFGHPEPGVFDELAEQLVVGVAAQAAVAIENAELYLASQDEVAERRRVEQRQELLLAELSHRVKNMLAVMQAIARQSAVSASTVPGFVANFRGRLGALAAAHDLLTASGWRGVGLAGLAQAVLAPHVGQEGRLALELSDVPLQPALAQSLALVFHELATNAAKHGALSSPEGKVRLSTDPTRPDLVMVWREQGGPPVMRPAMRGFGTTLLEGAVAHQHGGQVELDWRVDGLVCRLSLPIQRH